MLKGGDEPESFLGSRTRRRMARVRDFGADAY
jgi:hypothetical protein